jgi:hypothetical protein
MTMDKKSIDRSLLQEYCKVHGKKHKLVFHVVQENSEGVILIHPTQHSSNRSNFNNIDYEFDHTAHVIINNEIDDKLSTLDIAYTFSNQSDKLLKSLAVLLWNVCINCDQEDKYTYQILEGENKNNIIDTNCIRISEFLKNSHTIINYANGTKSDTEISIATLLLVLDWIGKNDNAKYYRFSNHCVGRINHMFLAFLTSIAFSTCSSNEINNLKKLCIDIFESQFKISFINESKLELLNQISNSLYNERNIARFQLVNENQKKSINIIIKEIINEENN